MTKSERDLLDELAQALVSTNVFNKITMAALDNYKAYLIFLEEMEAGNEPE
jgi:hypothetical protein